MDREAARIGWTDMLQQGRIRAIRKTTDGRYVVAVSSRPAPDAPRAYFVAPVVHIALATPAFLDDLVNTGSAHTLSPGGQRRRPRRTLRTVGPRRGCGRFAGTGNRGQPCVAAPMKSAKRVPGFASYTSCAHRAPKAPGREPPSVSPRTTGNFSHSTGRKPAGVAICGASWRRRHPPDGKNSSVRGAAPPRRTARTGGRLWRRGWSRVSTASSLARSRRCRATTKASTCWSGVKPAPARFAVMRSSTRPVS